jgi:hypothetical protein
LFFCFFLAFYEKSFPHDHLSEKELNHRLLSRFNQCIVICFIIFNILSNIQIVTYCDCMDFFSKKIDHIINVSSKGFFSLFSFVEVEKNSFLWKKWNPTCIFSLETMKSEMYFFIGNSEIRCVFFCCKRWNLTFVFFTHIFSSFCTICFW